MPVMLERSQVRLGEAIASKLTMNQYYVYILTNYKNTVLYSGITSNLVRRVYEHKQKLVDGFSKKYNVNKLIYYEVFRTPQML